MKKPLRVLYLYSGERKAILKGIAGRDYPDTQLYGLNHFRASDVDAHYREWGDVPGSRWLSWLDFRIKHLLLYPFTRGYDLVFGSSVLYLIFLKKILRPRAKFVLLNIGLTRMFASNRKKGLKHAVLRWLLSGIEGVVCLARFQVRYLEERFPQLAGKVWYVPLGVDTQYYQPQYERRKEHILAVGRDNGRDYRALADVARHMPEQEFHIVCSARNIEGITFPGNVQVRLDISKADLYRTYHEARLLLQLTKTDLTEGSDCSGQTVLLDAMACGLPVVLNRTPYVEDYVTDGQEAVVIEGTDVLAVERGIASLEKVELRDTVARAARARAEREFSTERMAEGLAKVFTNVMRHDG